MLTHLLIGLGNPGDDYAATRHNIGFMALDAIARRAGFPAWKQKFQGRVAARDDLLLLQPLTYMNDSGQAAQEALRFHKLAPAQTIVFHDDLDLQPGEVRVKQGGGTGGHNGLKSLDACIGPDYWRVRLGIGRPMTEQGVPVKGEAVTHYVLNPFSRADRNWLTPQLDRIADHYRLLLTGQAAGFAKQVSAHA